MLSDISSQKSLQAVDAAHYLLEADRLLPKDRRFTGTVAKIIDVNNRGTVATPDQLVSLCLKINNTHELWDALKKKIGDSDEYRSLREKFDESVDTFCENGKPRNNERR